MEEVLVIPPLPVCARFTEMELYLRWLEKNEMKQGEESPLGLILCAEGKHAAGVFVNVNVGLPTMKLRQVNRGMGFII